MHASVAAGCGRCKAARSGITTTVWACGARRKRTTLHNARLPAPPPGTNVVHTPLQVRLAGWPVPGQQIGVMRCIASIQRMRRRDHLLQSCGYALHPGASPRRQQMRGVKRDQRPLGHDVLQLLRQPCHLARGSGARGPCVHACRRRRDELGNRDIQRAFMQVGTHRQRAHHHLQVSALPSQQQACPAALSALQYDCATLLL